ncbi:MAG: hypothetical protein R3195_04505 [Gemmatimonadota bacterium]|nr:hypothetical protein [Gemmatimonadota bacterium]
MRESPPGPAPLVAAALTLSVVACDTGPTADGSTVRDSAGVEIVESTSPVWSAETAPRIATEPRIRIGALDGPEELQLFEVRFSTVLSDGRIVIANSGTGELRYFRPDGTFELAVGGQGEGPGEFGFISSVFSRLPGDTLRLFDGSTRRLTEFTGTGELVRSYLPDPPTGGDLGALFSGTFSDGRIAVSVIELPPVEDMSEGDLVRGERTYFTLEPEGTPREVVRLFEPERLVRIFNGNVGIVTLPFRFSEQAIPHDDLVVSSTDRHRIRWYTPDGRLHRIARWDGDEREMTRAHFEEWLAALPYEEDRIAQLRQQNEGLPLPPELPTSTRMLVDADGNAWLERYRLTPAEPAMWTVIGPDGTWLGDVEMPDGLEPHEIGRDYVIGLWEDELDVAYVHLHALVR